MIRRNTLHTQLLVALMILIATLLAGCAAKKALVEAPETGVVLEYQMPDNQVLKYELSNRSTQNLEIQGLPVEVDAYKTYTFSVESEGLKDGNHQLVVTIDAMDVNVTGPQGDISGDVRSVVGKSFSMVLSPLGEEVNLSGARHIQYEMQSSGKRSIMPDFEAIFPDLAAKPVKIGDTWTTRDTIKIEESGTEIHITFESVNTLEGFETVNGLRCAKMASDVTGTLSGEGKEGEVDLVFAGELEGSDTWYFAYEEGLFVKMLSDGSIEGTITAAGPQSMRIPMAQMITVEISLIE